MTRTIEARFRIATPMFCGGAEQQAELRLQSFKGALRFWWRALAWGRYRGDLGTIKKREDELFGSSETGQSAVSFRIAECKLEGEAGLPSMKEQPGIGYLAGMGIAKRKGIRGGLFSLLARLKEPSHADEVEDALKMLGLLGGLGARSRRALGSLVLESLSRDGQRVWVAPRSMTDLERELKRIRAVAANAPDELPPYSALYRDSRIVAIEAGPKMRPIDLLEAIGREFLRFRAWGQNGKVLGRDSETNFRDDHDLMLAVTQRERPKRAPRRSVFGLPHNYYFKSRGQGTDVTPEQHDRRASPLFFHIHAPAGATPSLVLVFLPSDLLPRGDNLVVGGHPIHLESAFAGDPWEPVDAFLDRLQGRGRKPCVEKFGKCLEVTP